MEKCIIVARAKNGTIGNQGGMPWHYPEDLKHFKAVTMGCPVIMGSRTFDSIGKPLPGRLNIVLSTQNLIIEGAEVAKSLEEAYRIAETYTDGKVFVIGGASVYRQAMECGIDTAYVTEIQKDYDGDTKFDYNFRTWCCDEVTYVYGEKGDVKMSFCTYKREG